MCTDMYSNDMKSFLWMGGDRNEHLYGDEFVSLAFLKHGQQFAANVTIALTQDLCLLPREIYSDVVKSSKLESESLWSRV